GTSILAGAPSLDSVNVRAGQSVQLCGGRSPHVRPIGTAQNAVQHRGRRFDKRGAVTVLESLALALQHVNLEWRAAFWPY
ncbi:hypothetical protein PFISCL1PPCAC_7586, partial [Pristionchus fissidentatus]